MKILPKLRFAAGDADYMMDEVSLLIMENTSLEDTVTRDVCEELYEEVPIKLAAPVRASSLVEIQLNVNNSGELKLVLIEVETGKQYEMIPTRKGGDADNLGMDVATGFTLV